MYIKFCFNKHAKNMLLACHILSWSIFSTVLIKSNDKLIFFYIYLNPPKGQGLHSINQFKIFQMVFEIIIISINDSIIKLIYNWMMISLHFNWILALLFRSLIILDEYFILE